MTEPRKIVCHAPGERCLGCDHYQGKADVCKYAEPEPTEPRKTPRTEAAELPWVANTQVAFYGPCVKSDFARALEIETQELAEALEAYVNADDWTDGIQEQALAALARHRAKQEGKP